jgi:hypothetical protein
LGGRARRIIVQGQPRQKASEIPSQGTSYSMGSSRRRIAAQCQPRKKHEILPEKN